MSSCTSVPLAFNFASLYKLVSDAGLMSLLHAVIRVFRNSFEGLGAWGWCAWGQRNVQLGFQRFEGGMDHVFLLGCVSFETSAALPIKELSL